MFDKLEQLRAKPPHIKKHIAFWTSAGITAVILVFWVTSLSVTLNNQTVADLNGDVYVNQSDQNTQNGSLADDQSGDTSGTATASAPTPLSAMTASVSNAFAPVGALLKSFASDFSSAAEQPATSSAVEIYAAPTAPDTQTIQNGQSAPMETMGN